MARETWLTPEIKEWLRGEIPKHSLAETTRRLNARFGLEIEVRQVKSANNNHKLGKANRRVPQAYTAEEMAFLRDNLPNRPRRDVVEAFLARFGRRLRKHQLSGLVRKYGLQGAPNAGRFKPSHTPANKGRKGRASPGSEKTRFRKGQPAPNRRPLYSERWDRTQQAIFIKIPLPSPFPSHRRHRMHQETSWVRKSTWIWQQAGREVPPGHVLIFLDGDRRNCSLDNLECVPRKVVAALNRRNAPGYAGPEANRARIRLAQLNVAIAERKPVARRR